MRLLLDEHYSGGIADGLRIASHDVVTVSDLGLGGIADEALLDVAAGQRRALLTNNARDFAPLARTWAAAGRQHSGLVFTSDASLPRHRGTTGRYVEILSALMEANPADDALAGTIRWLP